MEQESYLTPRKLLENKFFNSHSQQSRMTPSNNCKNFTPKSMQCINGKYNLLPVIQTPPSRTIKTKIMNPFDVHLADRLLLPSICSPSLFQRPSTPRESSQNFEWTIDEVSYLGPVNVEPCETQFMETPDPVLEAKAQAAISTYFQENNVVPSPMDCPFRNQKAIFKKDYNDTSTENMNKRDGICQTILTFPPILPLEIENALKPYFTFDIEQQQVHTNDETAETSIDHEARDQSLRRKLFETSVATTTSSEDDNSNLDLEAFSPAPKTPELDEKTKLSVKMSRHFGSPGAIAMENSPNISISPVAAKESFGSLSPISKTASSPITPILVSVREQIMVILSDSDSNAIYRSTPEKNNRSLNSSHMSVEVTSESIKKKEGAMSVDLKDTPEETIIEWEEEGNASSASCEGSSQSSMLSTSQQAATTPKRHQKQRNRKNLSHSFLLYSDEDKFEEASEFLLNQKKLVPAKKTNITSNFYRMDSGFNDDDQASMDVSMQYDFAAICSSSTPSTRFDFM